MIIIIEGIANVNINMLKYLFIIIDEDEDEDVDLARFWILNPKINDDVPINKETITKQRNGRIQIQREKENRTVYWSTIFCSLSLSTKDISFFLSIFRFL